LARLAPNGLGVARTKARSPFQLHRSGLKRKVNTMMPAKKEMKMVLKKFRVSLAMAGAWCLAATVANGAIILTTLVSFTGVGGKDPGASPYAGLVLGTDGNFYGTTSAGGSNNQGTVFRLTPDGNFTSLFSFNGTNGASPNAALTLAGNGVFYGTTFEGGVSNWGTLFLIATNGGFTNLFSFAGTNDLHQGANPGTPLVADGAGNFFGTANYGGTTNNIYLQSTLLGSGNGTIFKRAADGTVTVPFLFGDTNGAHPSGGLTLGKDGNFYGTTTWGGEGITGIFPGYGTIFKMNPDGTFTNLYSFSGNGDGGFIYAGLAQGPDGYLYGGAFNGGSQGYGSLFKISTNGDFALSHAFSFFESGSPYAGMTEGSDGNLYGTSYGYFAGVGSVFEISSGGVFTNLVLFNTANGAHPAGVLLQGPDNNFYGTTLSGGANGKGTIFKLSVPMPPVIKSISVTNAAVTLTWSTVAGQTYQLLYTTNLAENNWMILSKSAVASSGTMTATDPDASSAERFYSIVLLQ
jgi:uncharacterized repeat protein (TIGR03803 family)